MVHLPIRLVLAFAIWGLDGVIDSVGSWTALRLRKREVDLTFSLLALKVESKESRFRYEIFRAAHRVSKRLYSKSPRDLEPNARREIVAILLKQIADLKSPSEIA